MAKAKTPDSKKRRNEKPSQARIVAMRLAAWGVLLLLVCAALFGLHTLINRVFYLDNPRFVMRAIAVETFDGTVNGEDIRRKVRDYLATTKCIDANGDTNLFAIDLRGVRDLLRADPLVQGVEVRRKLPSTLALRIYTRVPMARLRGSNGLLIDDSGLVLPQIKRDISTLPDLVGYSGVTRVEPGDRIDDDLVHAALTFLRLRLTLPKGTWFDPSLVQIDNQHQQVRCILREKPEAYIRRDAILLLPAKNLQAAMVRAIDSMAQRVSQHQTTSQIDAWSSPNSVYVAQ